MQTMHFGAARMGQSLPFVLCTMNGHAKRHPKCQRHGNDYDYFPSRHDVLRGAHMCVYYHHVTIVLHHQHNRPTSATLLQSGQGASVRDGSSKSSSVSQVTTSPTRTIMPRRHGPTYCPTRPSRSATLSPGCMAKVVIIPLNTKR